MSLLTTDWLVIDVDGMGITPFCLSYWLAVNVVCVFCSDRAHQQGLVRIRRIYIPELIIQTHAMLVASRTKIPAYVPSFPSTNTSYQDL